MVNKLIKGVFLKKQIKNFKFNFSEKFTNFSNNLYDLETKLIFHKNIFANCTYEKENLIKQKEKLFNRGKPQEWKMNESFDQETDYSELLNCKEKAFDIMLFEVFK